MVVFSIVVNLNALDVVSVTEIGGLPSLSEEDSPLADNQRQIEEISNACLTFLKPLGYPYFFCLKYVWLK